MGNETGKEHKEGKKVSVCRFSGICQISPKLDFHYSEGSRLEWEKMTVRSGDTLQPAVFLQNG